MMRHLLVALVLSVAAAQARPADACSLAGTYIAPTNVELVAASPRIVIARATASASTETVTLEVEHVLRGNGVKVGDSITVEGMLGRYMGASPKLDFSRPRRGAFAGGCIAWDYAVGARYVLLLVPHKGTWVTRAEPFTRVNEEVDDENAPWAIAVREYARIADLPKPADRRKALDALVARGSSPKATPTDRAIADDVKAHLAAATPAKPFAELAALEKAGTANHARVLSAVGAGGDPAARAYMAQAIADLRAASGSADSGAIEAVARYYEKVADPTALDQLAAYYVDLGSQAQQERWPLMWLLIHRADARNRAVMEQALLSANDEEASRLGAWFVRFPSAKAEQDLLRRLGGSFGGGSSAHSDTTLALAGMGNKAVLAWAKQELTSPSNPDDRWIALYVIARSPLPEADALVPGIIAGGSDNLESLVQGYEEAQHRNADRRLAEIAKRKNLEPRVREWTERSIEARKARP